MPALPRQDARHCLHRWRPHRARHPRELRQFPRRTGTAVGVRSACRVVTPTVDRPSRSTVGRRVPLAAGARCELPGAHEAPTLRTLRGPQRPLFTQLPVGPGRSRRVSLLPTTRRGVGLTVPCGRTSATSPPAARRATFSTSSRRRPSTAFASPRAVCSIPRGSSRRHPTPARSRPCSPARPKCRAARTDRRSSVPRTGC